MPYTNEEILEKVKEFRADGVSGSANLFDRMRKAEDFVVGEQWAPEVKEDARNRGKFTLTIPIVKPQVKQVAGMEIENPQDFIVENTKSGSAEIAQILTALMKQAADSERAKYEKSMAFQSGLTSGQGVIGVFLDNTEDPKHKNLRIEKLIEHNVIFDPNTTSYNPNKKETGSKYVIYEKWVDKEYIEAKYSQQKAELEANSTQTFFGIVAGNVTAIIDWMTGRRTTKETGAFSSRERIDIDTMKKSRYLVNHTWWREPKKCIHWYDNRKTELESMFLCREKDISLAKKVTKESEGAAEIRKLEAIESAKASNINLNDPNVRGKIKEAGTPVFSIEEVDHYVMHHTIRIGDVFLEDRVDELNGVDMFPLVPYWAYWINGYKSGLAEDLIGTQEEINWSHSMALNIVKQLANSGWKIKEDVSGDFANWLRDHGGEHGIVIDESRGGGNVEKIEPASFPTFEIFAQRAMENAQSITGIRTERPEKDDKQLSGRAIFLKQRSSAQGSMSVFMNWYYSLAILGDLIVDIIRKNDIYSEDEIRETVDKDDLISAKLLDQAKGIIINQIQQQGSQIPQQPKPPNPIRMRQAPPQIQADMLEAYQEEMAQYEAFVNQVEQAAIPIAEEILISLIGNVKAGKYSTKVTTSPMSETMRAIKATEVFELQKLLLESADVGLDGEDLIEATDVPNKEKLIAGRQRKLETMTMARET